MRAIILSAGVGKRLHPFTETTPKCLLEVADGVSLLGFQLQSLAACGVREATVVVGFGAAAVEAYLAYHPVPGTRVRTLYNPFSGFSDNLVSAWLARVHMHGDFLLMNGDVLFERSVLEAVLGAPDAPLTLTVSTKPGYDDDDMKVRLQGARLGGVAKSLPRDEVDAESVGITRIRGEGAAIFRDALDAAVREPHSLHQWYLAVIDDLARKLPIRTLDVTGRWWTEIDSPEDLDQARRDLSGDQAPLASAMSGDLVSSGPPAD